MSTYLNVHQGIFPKYEDAPPILLNFIIYLRVRKNRSETTVNAYYIDLRMFIRYLMVTHDLAKSSSLNFSDVEIKGCPDSLILGVTADDIDAFLYFSVAELKNQPQRMARKLSAIKTFYKYLCNQARLLTTDPAASVEAPSLRGSRQPIYLTYDQCLKLLSSIRTESTSRDYCIISLFLNCGMRISELVGINLNKIYLPEGYIIILGKGNKERTAYLNEAARDALTRYLEDRSFYQRIIDQDALFVSERTGKRLTVRGVEVMVEKVLKKAGLGGMKFSPHKFRHTAATMMYDGGTDILAVSSVLGHKSVSTSQIYTHLHEKTLEKAVSSSPLASIKITDRSEEP